MEKFIGIRRTHVGKGSVLRPSSVGCAYVRTPEYAALLKSHARSLNFVGLPRGDGSPRHIGYRSPNAEYTVVPVTAKTPYDNPH